MSLRRTICLLGLPAVTALLLTTSDPAGSRPLPPLEQSAYVWQRAWTASVTEAAANAPAELGRLIVLAGHIDWNGPAPRVVAVHPDYGALSRTGRPVGLAVRIAARRAPLLSGDPALARISQLARQVLAEARAAGLNPVELQIDYDSPERRLDEYRAWLAVIRGAIAPTPLTITALPCWLRHAECRPLVRATDGFVLQVHSLDRPAAPGMPGEPGLIDVPAARRAVHRAAGLGVPFDVALPTYAVVAAFGPGGRLLGLDAEGPPRDWPRDADLREVRADPATLAALVREWHAGRPRTMRGVIWYRLPVPGDRHNWSRETLAAVIRGEAPKPALEARAALTDGGRLIDVSLVNTGLIDIDLAPVRVSVRLTPDGVESRDGQAGFLPAPDPAGIVFSAPAGRGSRWLRPGERCAVGWVRLAAAGQVEVQVASR